MNWRKPAKFVSHALMGIGGVSVVVAILLGYRCTESGSLRPDLQIGLTYPVDMHGTLFVSPALGFWYEHCLWAGIILLFAGGILWKFLEYKEWI